jgi:hypothetical protein
VVTGSAVGTCEGDAVCVTVVTGAGGVLTGAELDLFAPMLALVVTHLLPEQLTARIPKVLAHPLIRRTDPIPIRTGVTAALTDILHTGISVPYPKTAPGSGQAGVDIRSLGHPGVSRDGMHVYRARGLRAT